MILGMTTSTFTLLRVLISLAGIGSVFVVVYGLLTRRPLEGWTKMFLATTALTSLTGFLFPVEHLLPSHVVGLISLVALTIAIVARYALHLGAAWRWIYVVCVVMALYLNCFVAVVQSFLKLPAPESTSSNAERATISDGSTSGDGDFRCARHPCREEIPGGTSRNHLIGTISIYLAQHVCHVQTRPTVSCSRGCDRNNHEACRVWGIPYFPW